MHVIDQGQTNPGATQMLSGVGFDRGFSIELLATSSLECFS
jgi:hypothetical protein